MSYNHHPDDATLLSYAAGGLPESFDIVLACHLETCNQCQAVVADAEQLGGLLLDVIAPVALTPSVELEALLDAAPERGNTQQSDDYAAPDTRQQALPKPLQQLLDKGDHNLPWRWLAPGIQQIRLPTADNGLRLLKIAAGVSIPQHSHQGSELTLVLQGAYQDSQGYFAAGDLSDAPAELSHQPITQGDQPCICLVATDGPLQYQSLLARLVQPLTGF